MSHGLIGRPENGMNYGVEGMRMTFFCLKKDSITE